jgi:hypothetical protein
MTTRKEKSRNGDECAEQDKEAQAWDDQQHQRAECYEGKGD